MTINKKNTNPFTAKELQSFQPLEAVETLKEPIILNLNTFSLHPEAKAYLEKIDKVNNIYRVKAEISLENIRYNVPFDNLPSESLDIKKLEKSKFESLPNGLRPNYLTLKFLPHRIKLELNERANPPFDFDYKREDELVDKPTNVFTPDDRYIYQDNSFPWCTVGRIDTPLGTGSGCIIGSRLLLLKTFQPLDGLQVIIRSIKFS